MLERIKAGFAQFLSAEIKQAREEGRLITDEMIDRIRRVVEMPGGEEREAAAAALLDASAALPYKTGINEREPSCLESIKKLRPHSGPAVPKPSMDRAFLLDRVYGAWLGRCAGCLLGMPVEGRKKVDIDGILKSTGNYPLNRYLSYDVPKEVIAKYDMNPESCWIDKVTCMPEDDDTNYTVLALRLMERKGRSFTPCDVAAEWMNLLPVTRTCTAEKLAYRNFLWGKNPPESAAWRNPCREWIGAQIRADFFGYVNPGDPEMAADMAWRDASISHVKNGIYGAMWVAAMLAAAYSISDPKQLLLAGLAQVPAESRLHQVVMKALDWRAEGIGWEEALDRVHELYDEYDGHEHTHTISNALICAIALLWCGGDYEKAICIAVMGAFDTDCNAATVGSIIGLTLGAKAMPAKWTNPLNGQLYSGVDGCGLVSIGDMAERTVRLMC